MCTKKLVCVRPWVTRLTFWMGGIIRGEPEIGIAERRTEPQESDKGSLIYYDRPYRRIRNNEKEEETTRGLVTRKELG